MCVELCVNAQLIFINIHEYYQFGLPPRIISLPIDTIVDYMKLHNLNCDEIPSAFLVSPFNMSANNRLLNNAGVFYFIVFLSNMASIVYILFRLMWN